MLEGSIILLVFGCIAVLYVIVTWFRVVGESIEVNAKEREHKKRQKKGTFHFERLDEVQGILTVNGKKMKTYNVGELSLDGTISIRFYDRLYGEIQITDIYYLGKSIYSFASGTWKEKADYAVSVLKTMVNNGELSPTLVSEVEEIILEVEDLNKHIEAGRLVRTDDEAFGWVF